MSGKINRVLRLLVPCVLTGSLFVSAHAGASVIYTSRTSTVSVPATTETSTDLSPFSASVSTGPIYDPQSGIYNGQADASQSTQISGNTISGTLGAHAVAGNGIDTSQRIASSSFQLDFTLDTATSAGIFTGYSTSDGSIATVLLSGPTSWAGPDAASCNSSGVGTDCLYNGTKVLAAGQYTLNLFAAVTANSPDYLQPMTDMNFQISFTPVPLPESGVLLISALGILALIISRKRHGGHFTC